MDKIKIWKRIKDNKYFGIYDIPIDKLPTLIGCQEFTIMVGTDMGGEDKNCLTVTIEPYNSYYLVRIEVDYNDKNIWSFDSEMTKPRLSRFLDVLEPYIKV